MQGICLGIRCLMPRLTGPSICFRTKYLTSKIQAMKTLKDNETIMMRFLMGGLLTLLSATSFLTAGCPSSSGGVGKFTSNEKKAMTTKVEEPEAARKSTAAMAKPMMGNHGKPTANANSPWNKPQ